MKEEGGGRGWGGAWSFTNLVAPIMSPRRGAASVQAESIFHLRACMVCRVVFITDALNHHLTVQRNLRF